MHEEVVIVEVIVTVCDACEVVYSGGFFFLEATAIVYV